MRRAIITIGLAVLAIILISPCAIVRAEQIKIGFAGSVNGINDPYHLLQGAVQQGTPITGYYIYDSATTDSDPSVYTGIYKYTTAPYGMVLTIGSLTFQTDPLNVNFMIGLTNNYYGEPWDDYTVTSYNNLSLNNSVPVSQLHWQLEDYPGTAISSDALLTTAPNLSEWSYNNMLSVSGGDDKTLFQISGNITSAYLMPEPATLFLLGVGGFLIRKRN
jgi:hypothetical protein